MDKHRHWYRRQLMEQTAQALEQNGFATALFDDRDEAVSHLLDEAATANTIGFGGSMTLVELGLPGWLEQAGRKTLVHSRSGLSPEEKRQIMQEQLNCDLFFTSTNALTTQGHLVNIDAIGNRTCSMAFGPKKVVVVAGVNKIVPDLESALRRIRDVAAPPNARRLGYSTPCAITGRCSDCSSPDRICRITTIIERRPRTTDLRICLINQDLGY